MARLIQTRFLEFFDQLLECVLVIWWQSTHGYDFRTRIQGGNAQVIMLSQPGV